jgi:hypothetical protein
MRLEMRPENTQKDEVPCGFLPDLWSLYWVSFCVRCLWEKKYIKQNFGLTSCSSTGHKVCRIL